MGRSKTWREIARPLIAEVIRDNRDKSEKEIKRALREAYPWGERAMHPYKIWCDEIKVQMGKKKFKQKPDDPNQIKLL